jgi:hypothetical protein
MAYSPDLLAKVLGLGGLDDREARLQQQIQRAAALRRPSGQQRSTPLGAALGGLADVGSTVAGGLMEARFGRELADVGQQRVAGRQAFLEGVTGAEQRGKQDETAALLSQRPFVPMATDYNAQSLSMRDATARQGAQQRGQDAQSLALLSGDPALRDWARAQGGEDGAGLALRQQALEQSGQRLALAQASETRKAGLLERSLGLREQQARTGAEAAARKAAEKKTLDSLRMEEGLRKEVMGNPVTRQYLEAQVAFDKVQRAASDPSAAGDLALIFGVMKTLDPGSTVREGEFANAQNAGGIDDRVVSTYNRILQGQRLSPEQRSDFVRTARGQFDAHRSAFEKFVGGYRGVTERSGADFRNVLPLSLGAPVPGPAPASAQAAPQARPTPAAQPPAMSPEDAAALDWAQANPNDPRAAQILQRLGVQ